LWTSLSAEATLERATPSSCQHNMHLRYCTLIQHHCCCLLWDTAGPAACLTDMATLCHEHIWQGKQVLLLSKSSISPYKGASKLGLQVTKLCCQQSCMLHLRQELSSCHRTIQLGDDVARLTYVGTHIHNNILVLDLDPVLQVALLFHNLFVDEKSFNLGLSRHRPTIG